jgi:hypothetical protein
MSRLIDPHQAHSAHLLGALGAGQLRDALRGTRLLDRFGDPQPRKRPALAGEWGDGSTQQQLVRILHEAGVLRDQTELGEFVEGATANEPFTYFTRADQTAADVSSSTDTTNFVSAISVNIDVPWGIWRLEIMGGLNLAHSAGGTVERGVFYAGTNIGSSNATMLTTREHYPIGDAHEPVLGVHGGSGFDILQIRYRPTSAGTASARAPWVIVMGRRIG